MWLLFRVTSKIKTIGENKLQLATEEVPHADEQ
jgi:hypothetical protein